MAETPARRGVVGPMDRRTVIGLKVVPDAIAPKADLLGIVRKAANVAVQNLADLKVAAGQVRPGEHDAVSGGHAEADVTDGLGRRAAAGAGHTGDPDADEPPMLAHPCP